MEDLIYNRRLIPMAVVNKKPSNFFINRYDGHCPNCDWVVGYDPTDEHYKDEISYCRYCGQAVFWGKHVEKEDEKV